MLGLAKGKELIIVLIDIDVLKRLTTHKLVIHVLLLVFEVFLCFLNLKEYIYTLNDLITLSYILLLLLIAQVINLLNHY